jgi:hypothetical protein
MPEHFGFGGYAEIAGRRWMGRVSGEVRFGVEQYAWDTMHHGELTLTNGQAGGSIGLETGPRLINSRHHTLDAFFGVGMDMVQAIAPDPETGDDGRLLSSHKLAAGISFRHYPRGRSHPGFGFELVYERSELGNEPGTLLRGWAWSFRFVVSGLFDRWRAAELEELQAARWSD